jgi:SAM-dependent methyltransferase
MIDRLVKKARELLRVHGLFGALGRAVRGAGTLVRERRWRRVRRRMDKAFDEKYGVDTGGLIPVGALDAVGPHVEQAVHYGAMFPEPFREVMAQLPIDYEQSLFVDFGSGKGRAVLLASELPFKKIVGVEFSPRLTEIAEANCRKWRSASQKSRAIELLCMDALDYDIPPLPAVLYFYNPFDEELMWRISGKIERSLVEAPRRVFVVYFNPRSRRPWDGNRALTVFPVRQPAWPEYSARMVAVWVTRGMAGVNP